MGSYVLKNCDIANIETLRFERKDIVIKDDTIETISDNVSTYDADATVIDAAGKMVLPGL